MLSGYLCQVVKFKVGHICKHTILTHNVKTSLKHNNLFFFFSKCGRVHSFLKSKTSNESESDSSAVSTHWEVILPKYSAIFV